MALGIAAYMLFVRLYKRKNGVYVTVLTKKESVINDDWASFLYSKSQDLSTVDFVNAVLSRKELWDTDLSKYTGFLSSVLKAVSIIENGMGTISTSSWHREKSP